MFQPQQDHLQVKERIVSFIKIKGPSLPVHIGKEINASILFTSAFLSELISEKRLKISNLNVGNSHLYFIPGNEPLLEGFSQHLRSKEKDAFELLKQKRILRDSEQHPAIRVALREIKDFAIPFKKDDQFYWKYLMVSDQELISEQIIVSKKEEIKDKKKIIKKEIFNKKTPQKKGDKFFNKVKEFLSKSSIEILDVEDASKDNLILKIKINNKERLLVAYNKKKIDESDIIKAYKKSLELDLEYIILSLGEPVKKMNEFIEAVKKLDGIKKIE